jgi:hypothetical protein
MTIDIATASAFFGWCTVINYGILAISTVMFMTGAGDWAKSIHSRLFDIPKDDLGPMYFHYLANFKLAVLIFNLVPYIALKILG